MASIKNIFSISVLIISFLFCNSTFAQVIVPNAYFSPTLNFHNETNGLQFAISIDDQEPQIISLNKEDNQLKTWENWVAKNIIIKTSRHSISKARRHIIKYWLVDPRIVLQKIIAHFGDLPNNYLGPPETLIIKKINHN